jgi:amino acid transporter
MPVSPETPLKRSLTLPLITLYGLGTTIGGGIYVLIGGIAGRAGLYAPFSFILAALLATLTAFSFAELSSRFPQSAGEAVYVHEGLKRRSLAMLVGFLVIGTGVISAAAMANGFVGYFHTVIETPVRPAIIGIVLLIGLIAFWGIGESVGVAALITLVEIGGLVLIIWVGRADFADLPAKAPDLLPPLTAPAWLGILGGSFLAYFAFIGFEDMVNVAEEVKDVRRTLPIAIVTTLVLTTVLYVGVSLVAVLGIPLADLKASQAPLTLFYEYKTGGSGHVVTMISIFALLNGALIQIIMAARVLYGMSKQGWLPGGLAHVNARTRTPDTATAIVTVIILLLALGFAIETLAEMTTFVIMLVSILVNASLWRVKRRDPMPPPGVMTVPAWIPAAGFLITSVFAVLVLRDLLARVFG